MTEPVITRHAFDGVQPTGVVSFTSMADGTADDYALLDIYERVHAVGLAGRVMETLERMTGSLGGYQITRLEHSLQSATRARLAGADVNWIVAALVHDIGDELAPFNHSEYAAAILQPYVPAEVHWVVEHHGVFQSYYYAHHFGGDRDARDQYRQHRWGSLCEQFCADFDQNCFDPDFPIDELRSFENALAEVFGRVAWSPDGVAVGSERIVP